MKNKKKLLLSLLSIFSISAMGVIPVLSSKTALFSSFSEGEYTCDLPTDYVELDEVITRAIDCGGFMENDLSFRGTVTRRVGDYCFLQRVNQIGEETFGIIVIGLDEYGNDIAVGNVVDFLGGGELGLDIYGAPTYKLTSTTKFNIAYSVNTKGYSPEQFSSLEDYSYNGLVNSYSDIRYSLSQYVTIDNLYTSYYNQSTEIIEGVTIPYFEVKSVFQPNDYDYMQCYINSGDNSVDEEIIGKIAELYNNGNKIQITGHLRRIYGTNLFEINSIDDVSSSGSKFDLDVVSGSSSTYFLYASQYSKADERYYSYGIPTTKYSLYGYENIPFMEFYDAYFVLFAFTFTDEPYENALYRNIIDDDLVAYYLGDYRYVVFDSTNDAIYVYADDGGLFDYNPRIDSGAEYIADGIETNYCQIDEASSIYHQDKTLPSFNLAQYGIDIIIDKYGNVFLPIPTLIDLLTAMTGYGFAWNGYYIFYTNAFEDEIQKGNLLDYFYNNSLFKEWDIIPEEYAIYAYNEFCFGIDIAYGLRDVRNINSADELLADLGYKEGLLSTDPVVYEQTLARFIGEWYYDGHSGYTYDSPLPNGETSSYTVYNYYLKSNSQYTRLMGHRSELQSLRGSSTRQIGLNIYDDMAIITFDSFVKYYKTDSATVNLDDYTYAQLASLGTDLLFKKAFKEIQENGDIKNVVLDITCNGGGMVDAIPFLEAYMSLDPSITICNKIYNDVSEIHYDVDLNQNGVFGEADDTFGDDYNFYLLVSNFSFSCGNYFPTVLKERGFATLIGETSGGGSCSVGTLCTAYGSVLRNSSNFQLGYWDEDHFQHNEAGITPDHLYDWHLFYDDSQLKTFIDSL